MNESGFQGFLSHSGWRKRKEIRNNEKGKKINEIINLHSHQQAFFMVETEHPFGFFIQLFSSKQRKERMNKRKYNKNHI